MAKIKVYSQTDVQHATLARRLAAFVYDTLIVIAILFFVGGIGVALNNGEAAEGPLMESAYFVAVFLFNGYFWTRSGQTIGMMAWRLRVQTVEGYSLSWTHALKRFFVAIFSIAMAGAGYWWMLFSDQKLTWHDQASSSRVVLLPKRKKDKK